MRESKQTDPYSVGTKTRPPFPAADFSFRMFSIASHCVNFEARPRMGEQTDRPLLSGKRNSTAIPCGSFQFLYVFDHFTLSERRKSSSRRKIPARTRGHSLVPLGQKGRRPHVLRGPGARARARARALSRSENLGNSTFF